MNTLPELQQAAHAIAKEKGWWDGERDPDEVYANFHAEISEAWEEYRSGLPIGKVMYAADGKPCGFFVELVDLVIRIADAAQAWGMDIGDGDEVEIGRTNTVPRLVVLFHSHIAYAGSNHNIADRDERQKLRWVVELCFAFARLHNVDLHKVISLKMAYNRTRPRKHGKIA